MARLKGPIDNIICPNCPPNPNPQPLPPGMDNPLADISCAEMQLFLDNCGISGGAQGEDGTQGAQGTGFQGPEGPQGNMGVQGPTNGPQGFQGPQGIIGPVGNQGPMGPQGITGQTGVQGITGPLGNQGFQGYQGVCCPGPQGLGVQGASGTPGATGPAGHQGSQGATGGQGSQGPGGSQGAPGTQGPEGSQGPAGAQGNDGSSATLSGDVTGPANSNAIGQGAVDDFKLASDARNQPDFMINGGFNHSQLNDAVAGYQFNSTGTDKVTFDGWKIAMQNNGVNIYQLSNAGVGGWDSDNRARFQKVTSAGKMLLYQILDNETTRSFSNKPVTVSIAIAASATPVDFTLGFIEWNGTADSVGTQLVSNWTTDPPTLNTNFSYYNTFNLTNSGSGVFYWFVDTGNLPDNIGNLIPFICTRTSFNAGDYFDIGQCSVNIGSNGQSPFKPTHPTEDLLHCERYIEKSYNLLTMPGTNTQIGAIEMTQSGTSMTIPVRFRVRKLKAPTITLYSTDGTSGAWNDQLGFSNKTVTASNIGETGCTVAVSSGTDHSVITGHIVVDGSL